MTNKQIDKIYAKNLKDIIWEKKKDFICIHFQKKKFERDLDYQLFYTNLLFGIMKIKYIFSSGKFFSLEVLHLRKLLLFYIVDRNVSLLQPNGLNQLIISTLYRFTIRRR